MTNNDTIHLSSYVPNLIIKKLAQNPVIPDEPSLERFKAVVLFADISGFTGITERLVAQGPEGVETISQILNDYFSRMVETIHAYGGDVVKFAGDALLAIWHEDEGYNASIQAASCALTLQKNLHDYSPIENVLLSMRIGLGVGDAVVANIGGLMQRWEFAITGSPVVQASLAQRNALPGKVNISPEMLEQLGAKATIENDVLLALDSPTQPDHTPKAMIPISSDAIKALQAYIPAAIANFSAGQVGWTAELRHVTVLFIELPDFGQADVQAPAPDIQARRLAGAQMVMRLLQETLYRYEGSINKIAVDDKGVNLLAAMGLPPFAHSDDPIRGVLAALDIVEQIQKLGLVCRIGVATGMAFCGSIGSSVRREYTIIGQVVNLAARLKVAATSMDKKKLHILCDTATYEAARGRVIFERLPAISLKGIDYLVPIYQPTGRASSTTHQTSRLIGRIPERTLLIERLAALKEGKGGLIVLEGEAGMGKTSLVDDFLQSAEQMGIKIFVGAGDAIEKSASYHAWRPIFRQLFGFENPLDGAEAGRQGNIPLTNIQLNEISTFLRETFPEIAELAPLLNAVLPVDFAENNRTRQIQGQARAHDTQRLLGALLENSTRNIPSVIVLEDAHWLDSASWALIKMVANMLPNICILIVTRPFGDQQPADYARLKELPDSLLLNLQPMPTEDALVLVCLRLGVRSLPLAVSDLITQKAEGHPFFSEELAYALRDANFLDIKDGECQLNASVEEINSFIPNTIQGAITSRIDRLTPQQQLTLKVASVIGRVFAVRVLRDIHPMGIERPLVEEHLSRLEQLDLTPLDTPDPDLTYIFKHIITQEVAYNLMLFAQRKQLHRTVAEWYEVTYAEDLSPYYSLLAHHYSQSEERAKAIEYLVKAGEQALMQFANQEAIGFLSEALDLANTDQPRTPEARLKRAYWERLLGRAYLGMGNLPRTKEHLYRSLELLGRPMPIARSGVALLALQQLFIQILHLAFPHLFIVNPAGRSAPSPAENERRMAIFENYDHLFEIFYFTSDRILSVITGLNALNISEEVVPFVGRAQALINMGFISGIIGVKKLSQRYQSQAIEIAEAHDDLIVKNWVILISNLYRMGNQGTSQQIQTAFNHLEQSYESIGDMRRYGEARTLRSLSHFYAAEYQRNLELTTDFYTRLQKTSEMQQKIWSLQGQSRSLILMGRSQDAIRALNEAQIYLANNIDLASETIVTGLLARALWQAGEHSKAREAAEHAAWIVVGASLTTFSAQIGFDSIANTLLAILEEQAANNQPLEAPLLQLTKKVLRASHRFARAFPIHLASLYRSEGLYAWLTGNKKAARMAWQKSIDIASNAHMLYDEGMAHFELGRHAEGDERKLHLRKAATIFEKIGAEYDLKRTQI